MHTDDERAQREVDALLQRLDDPAPRFDANAVVAIARARTRERNTGLLVRAAGFALACGIVTAAYSAPGSPLPIWVASVVRWVSERAQPAPQVRAPAIAPEPARAGIEVAPGRELMIDFSSFQPGGQIRVRLADRADVSVSAPSGAATFSSGAERLTIDNRGAAVTFEIEIPRSAPRVEVRIGGHPLFLKAGAQVVTAAVPDSAGRYLLRPTSP